MVEKIIMVIMAAGAVLGMIDHLTGNRMHLGEKFEQGFQLLGSTAFAMAGILCLAPVLSKGISVSLAPLWKLMHLDPGMLGGIIAIDMGGYSLSTQLASTAAIGRFAGIIVASTLGCTVTFTIPVGMGILKDEDRQFFARGLMMGICIMPFAQIIGGIISGISLGKLLVELIPVFAASILLAAGIWKIPGKMIKGFGFFAKAIRIVSIIGLGFGAVTYMTGFEIIPGMDTLQNAMATVSGICIVMLGSLPVAELLQRALKKPLGILAKKTGLNDASITGLLLGCVSIMPAITMISDMDERGKIVNAAAMVCSGSAIAAHLGFAFAAEPSMILPLLITKFAGGVAGAACAFFFTRKMNTHSESSSQLAES